MAENELEVRLNKKITLLQQQINSLNAYVKRVHGQVTHPSTTNRIKEYVEKFVDSTGVLGVWTDYSTLSTIVGWSSFTTQILEYKIIADAVYVNVVLDGTSNSTLVTFTLPNQPLSTCKMKALYCIDDGMVRTVNGVALLSVGSDVVSCTLDADATAWTNANQKSIQGQFFYRIA